MNLAARVIEVFAEHGMAVDLDMIQQALQSKIQPPSADMPERKPMRSMNVNAKIAGMPEGKARQLAQWRSRRMKRIRAVPVFAK